MVKRTSSFYNLKATEGQQVRYTVTSRQFKTFPVVGHVTGGTTGFYTLTANQKGITYTLKTSDKNIEYTLHAPILRGNNADYIIKTSQPKQTEYVLKSTNTAVQEYVLKADVIRGLEANHVVKATQPKRIEYTVFAKTKPSVSYPIVSTNMGVTFELKNPTKAVRSTTKLVSIYDLLSAEKSAKVSKLMRIAQCASVDDKNTLVSSIDEAVLTDTFIKIYDSQGAARNHKMNTHITDRQQVMRTDKQQISINDSVTATNARIVETNVQQAQITSMQRDVKTSINAIKNTLMQRDIDVTIAEFKAIIATREFLTDAQDIVVVERLSELYSEHIVDIAQASMQRDKNMKLTDAQQVDFVRELRTDVKSMMQADVQREALTQIEQITIGDAIRNQHITPGKLQSSNVVHESVTNVADIKDASINHIVDTSINKAYGGVIIKGAIDLVKHQTAVTERVKQLNHTRIKVPQHKREQNVHHADLKEYNIVLEQQLHHVDKVVTERISTFDTSLKEPQMVVPNRELFVQQANIKESTKNTAHNVLLSNVKDAARLSVENVEIIEVQTSVTGRILQTSIADKERATIKREARTNIVNPERSTIKREHRTNIVDEEKATIKRIQNTNITDLERAIRDNQLHTHIANIEKGLRDKTLHATIVNPERSVHADKLTKITKFKESVRITELKTTIDDPVLALKPEKKKKKQIWLHMGKSSWLQGWKHWKTR